MAKAIVKCLYCNLPFDRNSEPFEKVGKRYAHKKCYENNFTESDMYKEKIYEFIKQIYGNNYKYQSIEAQRKRFIKNGMTNKGIYYSLKYYFEIAGGSVEKSEGRIGIVPYVYEEAEEYYKKINKTAENLAKSVQQNLKKRTINLDFIKEQGKRNKIDLNEI